MKFLGQGLWLDGLTLAVIALALGYRARATMPRPPVGVFTRSDIVFMVVMLVVMPLAYLHLPAGAVVTLLGAMMFGMAQLTLAPLIGGRPAALLALLLCGSAVGAHIAGHPFGVLIANDLLLALAVVGVTNLWAATGMTAGQVTGLAAALAAYDWLATGVGTTTVSFVDQVLGKPFAPLLASSTGAAPTFIGMGDCLLLVIWPLVASQAYGRAAGTWAVLVDVLVLGSIRAGFLTGTLTTAVPVATPLGALVIVQFLVWRARERRSAAASADGVPARAALVDGLRALTSAADAVETPAPDSWVALHGGAVVGTGQTPGAARRAARRGGVTEVPVTALVVGGRRGA